MNKILEVLQIDKSLWLTKKSGKKFATENPSTGEIIAEIGTTSCDEYLTILNKAQDAFLIWRMVPAPKRAEIVRLIAERVRASKNQLAELISLEVGKSFQESLGEIQEVIDMADFAIGQARMLYGKTLHSERPLHRMYEQWQPLGVVGVITAFNFPMAVWGWNAFLAAICGDTVVWKPSKSAALCAIALQKICDDVMHEQKFPAVFSLIIPESEAIMDDFVDNKKVALLSFTGSSSVGKKINQRVASRFGKIILECSGNNAVIVDETANLKLALPAIVFGAVGTSGQRCTTTRRLFLHEKIYDQVIESLIDAYKKIKTGDPLDQKNHMGPLINQQAVLEFEKAINSAKKSGGKILVGGKKIEAAGYFVEPTIVVAKNEWGIVQAETFAPILYVIKYKDFATAIELQNAVAQGLSSACFTENLKHAELFLSARGSDCGIANINIGTSGAEIGGAFGGEKETGSGREAGSDAWQQYMRRQTNTINWGDELPLAQGIKFLV